MTRATILNIAKIRVKNDMIVMVGNLPSKHKLHGQIGNKRNISDMKRVRIKCALSSNRKRGTIGDINSTMVIRRTQSRKMSRVRSHMKGALESRYQGLVPGEGAEGGPKAEDREAVAEPVGAEG
jgi:hypothetical protein